MIEIQHTARSKAPRSEVWALLGDLRGWHRWGPWVLTALDGDPANPVGARRTLTSDRTKPLTRKPYVMKERVTAFEPERLFAYDLMAGLPVRGYHAEVTLSDVDGGGTDIHWRATFKAPGPFVGGLWRGAMLKVVRDVSEALADEADRGSGAAVAA